jgi:lipopolysaccharide/colanic/teichoic acid biosynthesis glycosyltransferase
MIDLLVSSALLLLLPLPFFPLLAILVKLSSEGSIFYRWQVLGRNGRYLTGYKFRTMLKSGDAIKPRLLARNEMSGQVFKIKNDPHLIRAGRWLRTNSLDELPQPWSVLRGDTSPVGPGPPLQTEWPRFSELQKLKLSFEPGITCLWQASGRNRIKTLDKWVKLDLKYIRGWSLWLDLKILIQTIPAALTGRGAS